MGCRDDNSTGHQINLVCEGQAERGERGKGHMDRCVCEALHKSTQYEISITSVKIKADREGRERKAERQTGRRRERDRQTERDK